MPLCGAGRCGTRRGSPSRSTSPTATTTSTTSTAGQRHQTLVPLSTGLLSAGSLPVAAERGLCGCAQLAHREQGDVLGALLRGLRLPSRVGQGLPLGPPHHERAAGRGEVAVQHAGQPRGREAVALAMEQVAHLVHSFPRNMTPQRSSEKFLVRLLARPRGTAITTRHDGHGSSLKSPSATIGLSKRAKQSWQAE